MSDKLVEQVTFVSPESFLAAIRLADAAWGDGLRSSWVFRGHGDAEWELVPRSRRKDGWRDFDPLLRSIRSALDGLSADTLMAWAFDAPTLKANSEARNHVIWAQELLEQFAVDEFEKLADELGLRISDIPVNRSESYYPTLADAIAQHHGVPTRLLDWTRRPLVAAHFACASEAQSTHLAVWALDTSLFGCGEYDPFGGRLRLFQCPRSAHAFQHAQDGLYTWIKPSVQNNFLQTLGRWPSIVDLLDCVNAPRQGPVLRKLVLAREHVSTLRRMLWREQISQAHLMPTFDNVREAIYWKWRSEID